MKIVQFWHSSEIPNEILELIDSWKQLNPEAEHVLLDRQLALEFMEQNFDKTLVRAFDEVTLPAMVCDIFRVAYLMINGGIYVDCGSRCKAPIDQWGLDLSKMTVMRKWHGGVCNGLICAPAYHPRLVEIWKRIENVLRTRPNGSIWNLTGPLLFIETVDNDWQSELDESQRSVSVVDQLEILPFFELVGCLNHQKRAHWSKLQDVIPLFRVVAEPSTINKDQSEKHLTLNFVNNKLSKASTPGISSEKESDDTTFVICQNDQANTIESFLDNSLRSQLSSSNATIDISACMTDTKYNKNGFIQSMVNLSQLAENFGSCEVVLDIYDHSQAITRLFDISGIESEQDDKLNEQLSNPLLDYNLIDEALRFYFPDSQIKIRKSEVENPAAILSEEQLSTISEHFADSVSMLDSKYPHLGLSTQDHPSEVA